MNINRRTKILHRRQIINAPTLKLVNWWGCLDGMISKYSHNVYKASGVFKWRVRRALILSELINRVDTDKNWKPSKRLLKQMASYILLRASARVTAKSKQLKKED